MKKEPFGVYILRLLLIVGLFAFIGMLYWSSTLIEQHLKMIQGDLLQVKNSIIALQNEVDRLPASDSQIRSSLSFNEEQENQDNLLKKDPFYTKTLPKLLGNHFTPHGIRKEATIGKPNNLNPFNNWSEIVTWISLCSVSLAGQEIGKYETLTPDLAQSMELRYSEAGHPEFLISLRKDLFWQPLNPNHFSGHIQLSPFFLKKHQVTAYDVKFYLDAIMNRHVEETGAVALRNYFMDIEEISILDDFNLIVRWKAKKEEGDGKEEWKMKYLAKSFTASLRPLPRFVYQYFSDGTKIIQDDSDPNTYRTNPVWAQNFSHHWANHIIVSCGAWIFDGMTEREIRFRRNPHFYEPYFALAESFEIKFKDSPDAMWEDFKSGGSDLFTVPPNLQAEFDRFLASAPYAAQAKDGLEVKRLDYLGRSYNYIGWNQNNPLFKNKKVRQALTLAIDRERIIRQNLNGMGVQTTGTFFPYSPSYDPSLKPYPFDPELAKAFLREEGWVDHDGDGIIDQLINGKATPFRFNLTYYVKNPATKAISDYVATALKQIGIDCNPKGVDLADLSAEFEDKSFDALLLGWALGTPPEDPKQLWYSIGAKEKGSSNAIGFSNPEVDQLIEQLEYEYDPQQRIELYHRFDKIIYDEAPYTFLYAPKVTLAYRSYLKNVFIPADRQDLIPGANVGEPQSALFYIDEMSP